MTRSSAIFSSGQSDREIRSVPFQAPETIAEHRARLQRLAVDGSVLAYVDEGPREAEPILLVHGMPDSSWSYRKVIPRRDGPETLATLIADCVRATAEESQRRALR